eukprot:TRINITY_DN1326_c0_g5_i1.p1 TRINITY_DN1326_c0_g5~~TRINITY_DN1326_c0_g5_i1.p1  ORF type:complete len:693 (+),score=140.51 TRINITY_DN1326_c0_g5_i1:62-2080(+)
MQSHYDEIRNMFLAVPESPIEYTVNSVAITGTMGSQVFSGKFAFELTVLNKNGALVGLLPPGVAVEDCQCKRIKDAVILGKVAPIKDEDGRVTFLSDATHFVTSNQGVYQVELKVQVPYNTNQKQAVTVTIPRSTKTTVEATIPLKNITVSIPQAVSIEQDVADGNTIVTATILPSTQLSIKWTKNAEQKKAAVDSKVDVPTIKPKAPKEMLITSGQDYVHSIGGGICQTTLYQHFTIINGSASLFAFEIGTDHGTTVKRDGLEKPADMKERIRASTSKIRILSCDGVGISKWDVLDHPEKAKTQLLKVQMESSMEGEVHFTIAAELEMCGTSCLIQLPTVTPVGTARNKGNIAIQARTAVEIQEVDVKRLSKVDILELPRTLASFQGILHCYKFLSSQTSLMLSVRKHDDVDVLVATAEQAHYTITHTGEHLFYHLAFKVRNTQSQFARVGIPSGSTIWSALVQGSAVKPSQDREGSTLLPLVKGSDKTFSAELLFVKPSPLSDSQKSNPLKVELPTLNIPVNHLYVTLWMPEKNSYSAWEGDLLEVQYWSSSPTINEGETGIVTQPRHTTAQVWANCADDSCSSESYSDEEEDDDDDDSYAAPVNTNDVAAGIKPLTFKSTPLHTGRRFMLEKLLVTPNQKLSLSCETALTKEKKVRTLQEQKKSQCYVQ